MTEKTKTVPSQVWQNISILARDTPSHDPAGTLSELIDTVALMVDAGIGTEADADELAFISERLQRTLDGSDEEES